MKKQLLLLVMMLSMVVTNTSAVEIEIDGLWYDVVTKTKEAKIIKYKNAMYSGDIVIPQTIEFEGGTYNVTSIGSKAFLSCSGLTSLMISSGVTSIGEGAFQNCSGLASITISSNVTSIGKSCFKSCSSLTSIIIPEGVTTIEESTFQSCGKLNTVIIPSSVMSIGYIAFRECSSLSSVNIPNNVTSIGNFAFSYSGLTSLTIPNSVKTIGEYAFAHCYRLNTITIGNGVTSIGQSAFDNCNGLTAVHISDLASWCNIHFSNYGYSNPLTYAHHLYLDGEEITNLNIPNSVTAIGARAFKGCSGFASVTIPNSVTTIKEGAFQGCSGLVSINIPNSITSIEGAAFSGCSSLTCVVLGSGVKSIGMVAFSTCQELTDVYCLADAVPNTSKDTFSNSYIDYATLHVPTTSIEAYKTKAPWSSFKEVVALTDQELSIDGITGNNKTELTRYTIGGLHSNKGTKGLNIIKMNNGTVKKVIVK